jgi:aerobic-type carbon monoxide dehydrogenase small subunit (CoxS/CutS family)
MRCVREYFAKDAAISVGYCRGGRKMLVFAVLTDKSGVTADANSILVVHRSEHQLARTCVLYVQLRRAQRDG